MGPPTDAELLAAHRDGDAHAFGQLAGRHTDRMWGLAVRTLGNREEAADAVQEALVAAYRRAGTYRGEASVRTWLHRIVVNACIDRLRRERARPTVPWPAGEVPSRVPDHATELATRLEITEALAMLPPEQRMAVVLVDVQGWALAEVAEVLEVPLGTVKSRCARGRARLAALLGHLREEER
ncbi:RNA polymerase sigma factor SigM [Pseudonocardia sp.]|uniref:RNA polymerase sigma factor SigM n=1 Tax=Pseudonocardia sp. TaxID=60912 RepID=UPI00260B91F7|nr:RNA polymerase sigma factor SigM [Pseudonocardia sp.]MCW2722590.1 rpoE [Pseudonocardia sp.]MDT7616563.1 polymerase sigma-70 factor, subfamily [Pseudonocardiales bacterium]